MLIVCENLCIFADVNDYNKTMLLTVTDVEYLGDYTLLCTFSTGETLKVDLMPLLSYPAFEELRDPKEFIQFGLDQTIFWKNGADIAPERLYELGKAA